MAQLSIETIRRNMDLRPTLEVRAGTPFYIFLERDLVLEGPYVDRRSADERPTPAREEQGPADASVVDRPRD